MFKKEDKDEFKKVKDKETAEATPKKFEFIPKEKKNFKRSEALKLRKVHGALILVHILLLFGADIFIFDWETSVMVADSILLWLNFYNYMTLNKISCGINAAIYPILTIVALTHM